MAKKTPPKKRHHAEEAQPALIPMSEDELRSAGRELAVKVAELEELEAETLIVGRMTEGGERG